jgi:hypothetical protein
VNVRVLRRMVYWLATVVYVPMLILFTLPDLCILRPVIPLAIAAGFALLAVACGMGWRRVFPTIALIFALCCGINNYRYNVEKVKLLREVLHRAQARARELIAEAKADGISIPETNFPSLSDPGPSPLWGCCP